MKRSVSAGLAWGIGRSGAAGVDASLSILMDEKQRWEKPKMLERDCWKFIQNRSLADAEYLSSLEGAGNSLKSVHGARRMTPTEDDTIEGVKQV